MSSVISHSGNAIQKWWVASSHPHKWQAVNGMWWKGGKKSEPSFTAGSSIKMVQPHRKAVWLLLKMLNVESPCDPTTPLVGTSPRQLKTWVHTKTSTWMCQAVKFTGAKEWEQLRWPCTDHGEADVVHLHHGILLNYVTNDVETHTTPWVNLNDATLRNQSQNFLLCRSHLYDMCRSGKSMETEDRLLLTRGGEEEGEREGTEWPLTGTQFLFGCENIL